MLFNLFLWSVSFCAQLLSLTGKAIWVQSFRPLPGQFIPYKSTLETHLSTSTPKYKALSHTSRLSTSAPNTLPALFNQDNFQSLRIQLKPHS